MHSFLALTTTDFTKLRYLRSRSPGVTAMLIEPLTVGCFVPGLHNKLQASDSIYPVCGPLEYFF